jgi:nitrite reductase (NADH) small subunit
MSQFVPLCRVTETPSEGEVCEISALDRIFCVARLDGEIVVMDNACPHRGGPLGQGLIEQGRIVCPWHAWAFDLKTGCASHNPRACVRHYATRIEGEVVMVKLE